ncbi:MAG TPA: hypothetical protein DHV93_01700 [Holophagaceae bacterium]|nr:hypothetical protein [Holophagaceae bacterium]
MVSAECSGSCAADIPSAATSDFDSSVLGAVWPTRGFLSATPGTGKDAASADPWTLDALGPGGWGRLAARAAGMVASGSRGVASTKGWTRGEAADASAAGTWPWTPEEASGVAWIGASGRMATAAGEGA